MDIKGDKGNNWRRDKYIEYFSKYPGVETSTVALYSSIFNIHNDYAVTLAFYNCIFYSSVSSIFMAYKINIWNLNEEEIKKWWSYLKDNLIFGSARKHMKLKNRFVELIILIKSQTNNSPYLWLKEVCGNDINTSYNKLYTALTSMNEIGRFSADIFIATIMKMKHYGMFKDINLQSNELNYKDGSNLTSALLNILYKDEEATKYDKTGFISEENLKLIDEEMFEIQKAIKEKNENEDTNFQTISTKLCSFRNFFKKRRYPGFHQDRQQIQLETYRTNYPECAIIFERIYYIRSQLYGRDILGEYNNRIGMRNELKPAFINTGKLVFIDKKQLNLSDF